MAGFILTELRDEVGVITLNRPEVLNAWNAAMRDALIDAFTAFEADDAVRALILTGAGDRGVGARPGPGGGPGRRLELATSWCRCK